jgi:hypothetical protein
MPKVRSLDLGTLQRSRVSTLSFKILDAIQGEPLELMLPALGMTLEAMCEVKGVARSDVMSVVTNMLQAHGEHDDNYVAALRAFIKEDVPDVRRT